MSLCSLPVNTAVALGTQVVGWLCSIEQTDSVMCVLRRDEYLHVYICVWCAQNCVVCTELCGVHRIVWCAQNWVVYTELCGVHRIVWCTQNCVVCTELCGVHRIVWCAQNCVVHIIVW
jgi:hypothetical protein